MECLLEVCGLEFMARPTHRCFPLAAFSVLRVGVKRWMISVNKRRGFAKRMAGEERWKDEEHFLALGPSPQGQHSVNR